MGMFIDGQWKIQEVNPKTNDGSFKRLPTSFRHNISHNSLFKPEENRYHLIVSYACPWAHRTLIYRKVKGLIDLIPISVVNPYMLEYGWDFEPYDGVLKPYFLDSNLLGDLYILSDSSFTGRVTVPVLWDTKTMQIVNNESSEIIRIFNTAFNEYTNNTVDLYPTELRSEIDAWNDQIYHSINNGVYKVGFARSQKIYDDAVIELFKMLDKINDHLSSNDFLCNNVLTEADIRLFVTILRFDPVYVGHFKCNIRRIKDYEYLSKYMNRVRNYYDIEDTINMEHIKHHYYGSHETLNPSRIVPIGPVD